MDAVNYCSLLSKWMHTLFIIPMRDKNINHRRRRKKYIIINGILRNYSTLRYP